MNKYFRKFYGLCGLALALGVGFLGVPAAAASSDISGAFTHSYNADPSVQTGMIVEFKAKDQTTVIPLTSRDIRNMLGVVVPVGESTVVLTPRTASAQQVVVATSGRYNLLVSTQNGPIKTGDYLTISALSGIGMKAGPDQTKIVGRAVADFNGSNNVIGTVTLKNNKGRATTVSIGRILVDVQPSANPLFQNAGGLPSILSQAANGVANKPVSSARIYLSLVVLLATFFMTGNVFYSGIRNGIAAVGRNPLAKKAINRSLVQTFGAGIIIFAFGFFVVYLMLNL